MTLVTVPHIVTEEDNEAALARIAELMGAEPGSPEEAELDVLTTLVEAFEKKAYPIAPPSPQAMVRGLMDRRGLVQKDFVSIFGTVSRVSEFLAGKRTLSKDQAVGLHLRYGLPLELLLSIYDGVREDEAPDAFAPTVMPPGLAAAAAGSESSRASSPAIDDMITSVRKIVEEFNDKKSVQ